MFSRLGPLLLLSAVGCLATPITDLANTGNGAFGSPDSRWLVKLGAGTYGTVYVTDPGGFPIPPWLADNATSKWISPSPRYFGSCGTCSDAQNSTYTYELIFQLPSDANPATARFDFRVGVDNQMTNVYLNGSPLGFTYTGFSAFSSWFTVTSGFVAGQNTLEIVTQNLAGTSGNPAGLRLEFQNSDVATPEPGTWLMMAAGLCLLPFIRRSRS